ncbi:PPOX class F420-dependent oxidoreductase [Mycolicibacterium chlorophenolicum]|uniref:Putative pyridoxine/pyridoxamine 5'-phosphate oxidase n=1 Tax=Mycolicibacterium chlorophenolicum TaxID=37916 RepID=A0A0J6WNS2_9MYCO|nr:PPOX class F420-dependent oxidoreductase [Mycolicibacterium chlorophenolicum]KMO83753.1 putative pyridoxine/pyridoxamine 5'-phosphate oxidase [Mycolicibacterium chlorophenolicum]
MTEQDRLLASLKDSHRGVLATIRRDSRPQVSNVVHTFDPKTKLFRISTTADRAKTRNLRRDPRATYYVPGSDFWKFVVADTAAELTAVAQTPDDAVVDELVEVYREIGGEHPDWDEYRAEMVKEQRLVLRLHVLSLYGK